MLHQFWMQLFLQWLLKVVENNFHDLNTWKEIILEKLLHNTELKLELCSNLEISFSYVFIPILSYFSSYGYSDTKLHDINIACKIDHVSSFFIKGGIVSATWFLSCLTLVFAAS